MDDLPCRPERQAVADLVPDRGHPALFTEAVGVDPHPVRALYLFIHESMGRVPQGNLRSPREGKTEQAKPIIDSGSFGHLNGLGCCNAKAELRWGYAFKVGCVAKEGKNCLDIKGQAHGRPENMRHPVGLFNINTGIKRRFHTSAPLPP